MKKPHINEILIEGATLKARKLSVEEADKLIKESHAAQDKVLKLMKPDYELLNRYITI